MTESNHHPLRVLVEALGLDHRTIPSKLQITSSRYKDIISGKAEINMEELGKLKNAVPDLNLAAFVTSEGHPLLSYKAPYVDNRPDRHKMFYIAQKVTNLRNAYNLTQKELGEIAGIDRSTVSVIELGKQQYTLEALIRISKHFGISLDTLIMDGMPKHVLS